MNKKQRSHSLTKAQQRYWLMTSFHKFNDLYNMALGVHLDSRLNYSDLTRALKSLVDQQPLLRTYINDSNSGPEQVEMAKIKHLPLKIISEKQFVNSKLKSVLENEIQTSFNFKDSSPLWRLTVVEISPKKTYLFLVMHHLISDAWSFEVFFQQLSDIYLNKKTQHINNYFYDTHLKNELMHLSNKGAAKDAAIFWEQHLTGATFQLNFPFETSAPTGDNKHGAYHNFLVNESLYGELKSVAKKQKTSIFTLLFSAYAILLSKITQKNDFVIGTMVASRSTVEQNDVIGCFANILPLYIKIPDIQMQDFVNEVQTILYNVVEHQTAPFHDIIANVRKRSNSNLSDLFQTLFVFQNSLGQMSNLFGSEESHIDPNEYTRTTSEFPLLLLLRESEGGLCVNIQYSSTQFSTATIDSLCNQFENILSLINDSLEHNVNVYKALSTNEINLIESGNKTDCHYDYSKHFIDFFTEQVQLNPNKPALFVGKATSYCNLDILSSHIAKLLQEAGVKKHQIVAVCLPRNEMLIATLLAIFKLNAVYFPLDKNYNSERLFKIVDFAKPVIIVNNNSTQNITKNCNLDELNLDCCSSTSGSIHIEKCVTKSIDPAYLLFTSGSTGEPKPVLVYHKNLTNLLCWGTEYFSSEELSSVFAGSSVNFDASVIEIFLPLACGGQIVLAENILYYPDISLKQPIKLLTGTPSGVAALLRAKNLAQSTVSIFLSGEPLPSDLLKNLLEQPGIQRVINGYGLTELTAYSLVFSTNKFHKIVPIGKPISNTKVYILDNENHSLPVGAIGKLCITGDGVPIYENPFFKVSDERYISLHTCTGENIDGFLTGDLGQMLPDGNIKCLGRDDGQVKIRGYRIDRLEIEATIRQFLGVENVAVITKDGTDLNKVLIAFYQCKTNHSVNEASLRDFVSQKLPAYMVPTSLICIDNIPYNLNGKVDYRKLRSRTPIISPICADDKKGAFVELVKKVWCDVLSITDIDDDASFFMLGGHSLSIPLLSKEFKKILNLDIPITAFFMHVTVQEFSEYLLSCKNELPQKTFSDKGAAIDKMINSIDENDVAIIGSACRLPSIDSPSDFWNVLVNQTNLISEVPKVRWEWRDIKEEFVSSNNPCRYGAFIKGVEEFDARFFSLSDKEAKYMDPQQRLLLESAWEVIENAGYTPTLLTKDFEQVGVFIGASNSDYNQILAKQNLSTEIYFASGNSPSLLANRISYVLGFGGPSLTVDTACSSGLTALHYAVESVRKGENVYALVGSASLLLLPDNYIVWNKMGITSNNDKNQTFDSNASGFIPGEGVVTLLIKSAKLAVEDGDNILGVIKGAAINHDGSAKVGINAVSPKRQKDLIQSACRDAKLDINQIDYFEMHGTGTKLGDPVEISGLSCALSESVLYASNPNRKSIGSVKTLTGHTGPASGLVSLLKVLLCFENQQFTGTQFDKLNPNIQLDENQLVVNETNSGWDKNSVKRAGVSAFGFAGSNAHVVVESYLQQKTLLNMDDNKTYLFMLSAKSRHSLTLLVSKYVDFLSQADSNLRLADTCYTAAVGREHFKFRLIFLVKSISEISTNLRSYLIDECAEAVNKKLVACVETLLPHYCVATDYMRGNNIDWSIFWLKYFKDVSAHKIQLPTYAFDRKRFWINDTSLKKTYQTDDRNLKFGNAVFKTAVLEKNTRSFERQKEAVNYLIFADKYGFSESLVEKLGADRCILVYAGETYFKLSQQAYQINAHEAYDYKILFGQLKMDQSFCLIYCAAIEKFNTGAYDKLKQDSLALGHLVRNLHSVLPRISQFRFITTNAYEQNDSEKKTCSITQHALLALFKSLMLDQYLAWQIIDIENQELLCSSLEVSEIICSELFYKEIILRNGSNYLPALRPAVIMSPITTSLKCSGHYVITGGLGALGLVLTKWILECTDSKLTLLSRDTNKTLPSWFKSYQINKRVSLLKCDLIDIDQLHQSVNRAKSLFGEIHGVFHLAGTIVEGRSRDITSKTIDEVMLVKIKGTLNLLDIFSENNLDFIIAFSSLAAWYGRAYSAEYACSNAYLNGLALTHRSEKSTTPFYSLALCGIKDIGMGTSSKNNHNCIDEHEFLSMIEFYLNNLNSAVTYFERDISTTVKPILEDDRNAVVRPVSTELLIEVLSKITEIPSSTIDPSESVLHYGLDSMSALSLIDEVNNKFNLDCSITDIFSAKNIYEVVDKINQQGIASSPQECSLAPAKENNPDLNADKDSVAIIGLSFQFPHALNENELWKNLDATTDSVVDINMSQLDKLYGFSSSVKEKFRQEEFSGGFLQSRIVFDPLFFKISPQEAEGMCEEQRLLLVLAYSALEDSGHINIASKLNTGVYIGAAENFSMDPEVLQPHSLLGSSTALYANRISYHLDLHGPSISLNTLCSSSLVAMDMAVKSLRSGEINLALVGSARCKIDPNYYQGAKLMQAISKSGKCHSYSEAADGFSPGEGGAVFILKRLSEAEKDCDNILGVIRGSAVNNSGYHAGLTIPDVNAQASVINAALADAKINCKDVTYIEGHGTGTKIGDPIEIEALTKVFSDVSTDHQCGIGSIKANIGHLEPTSGLAGMVKILLSMRHKKIPGTPHLIQLNKKIPSTKTCFYFPKKTMDWSCNTRRTRIAGVSNFSIGGTNAHLILEEANKNIVDLKSAEKLPWQYNILVFSAHNWLDLLNLLINQNNFLENNVVSLYDLSYTLNTARKYHRCRIALCVENLSMLKVEIGKQIQSLSKTVKIKTLNIKPKKLILIFGGFSVKHSHFLQKLYFHFPCFKEQFDYCDNFLSQNHSISLLSMLNKQELCDEIHSELFSFVSSLSYFKVLEKFSCRPDLVMGHSSNEYAAACVSGVMSVDSALMMLSYRDRLLNGLSSELIMLEINAEEKIIADILNSIDVSFEITAINAKNLIVIAVSKEDILNVKKTLSEYSIGNEYSENHSLLHTSNTNPMASSYLKYCSQFKFKQNRIDFLSIFSGEIIPAGSDRINAIYFAECISQPIRLDKVTEVLIASYNKEVFYDMGRAILTQTNKIAKKVPLPNVIHDLDANYEAIPFSLTQMFEYGFNIDFTCLYKRHKGYRLRMSTYPFQYKFINLKLKDEECAAPKAVARSLKNHKNIIQTPKIILFLKEEIAKNFKIPPEEIDDDEPLLDLGADSLLLSALLSTLHNKFNITISILQLYEEIVSIKDLANHVEKLTSQNINSHENT